MSYILDALKKSEQERGNGSIPDVQTIHSSSLNYRNDKKAYWPYVLITAVILNLLAITYFIVNKDKPVETQAKIQSETAIGKTTTENGFAAEGSSLPVSAPVTASDEKKVAVAKPLQELDAAVENRIVLPTAPAAKSIAKESQIPKETLTGNTRADTPATGSGSIVVEFHDLPDSIKMQLPAIVISAHVYSSNPVQRSVVINNNFMEEGEYLLDDLILHEITADGAIFNYQGTLFNYGVVSGWQ